MPIYHKYIYILYKGMVYSSVLNTCYPDNQSSDRPRREKLFRGNLEVRERVKKTTSVAAFYLFLSHVVCVVIQLSILQSANLHPSLNPPIFSILEIFLRWYQNVRPRIDTRIFGVWLQYHCNTIGIPCNMTQCDHFFLEKCFSVSWEGLQVRGKMRNSASYSSAHHHLHPTHPNKREWKFIRARKLFANKKKRRVPLNNISYYTQTSISADIWSAAKRDISNLNTNSSQSENHPINSPWLVNFATVL